MTPRRRAHQVEAQASPAAELPDGVTHAFAIFTGNGGEPDCHRIGFWRVEVSTAGLVLEEAECPDPRRGDVTWAELHEMLGCRQALGEDLADMREEHARLSAALADVRATHRRYEQQVEALKAARAEHDEGVRVGSVIVFPTLDRALRAQEGT